MAGDEVHAQTGSGGAGEAELARLAVAWAYNAPYGDVLARFAAERAAAGDDGASLEADLLALGRRLLDDAAYLGRGELASLRVPNRSPYAGEHGPPRA